MATDILRRHDAEVSLSLTLTSYVRQESCLQAESDIYSPSSRRRLASEKRLRDSSRGVLVNAAGGSSNKVN